MLIVCGGEKTEPAYFDGLKREFRNGAVSVKVISKVTAPAQLVHHARKLWDRDRDGYDEVWCVVDVDEFDIDAAVRAAKDAGIRLAVSNPCFEFWLLLHFEHCTAHLPAYRDVHHRLRKHLPSYDKTTLDFAPLVAGVPDAVERAKAIDADGAGHARNPSTGVWRLVAVIS